VSAAQLWSQYQALIKTDPVLVSGLGDSPWVNTGGQRGRADTLALCLQKSPAQELSDERLGCEYLVDRAVIYVNRTGRDLDFVKAVLGYIVHDSQFYDDQFVAYTVGLLQKPNP
jgi:hypothetical protein